MKSWTVSLAFVAGCLLAESVARADQCQIVKKSQAEKAQAILEKRPKVLEFCEPCGEKTPGKAFVADTVKLECASDTNTCEVFVNGKEVDLAYLFVEVSPSKYENLAKKVGCPAMDVSPSVKVVEPKVEAPEPAPKK